MNFSKKRGIFLNEVINRWEAGGTISEEEANKLRNSFITESFQWREISKYAFWIAMLCLFFAFGVAIRDNFFWMLLEKVFLLSDSTKCLIFGVISAVTYYIAYRKKRTQPWDRFSNKTILFLGVLFTAVFVTFLGKTLDNGSGQFSVLFLISALIYGGLSFGFRSTLLWIFALLSFGTWFGTQKGYESTWTFYLFSLDYPLRFIIFGSCLVGLSFLMKHSKKVLLFQVPTYVLGLTFTCFSLWILSVFGNYGDLGWWDTDGELVFWEVLLLLISFALLIFGVKRNDDIARIFGVIFLLLNLYSMYFSYFWRILHETLFFGILAVSFWFIGKRAEIMRKKITQKPKQLP